MKGVFLAMALSLLSLSSFASAKAPSVNIDTTLLEKNRSGYIAGGPLHEGQPVAVRYKEGRLRLARFSQFKQDKHGATRMGVYFFDEDGWSARRLKWIKFAQAPKVDVDYGVWTASLGDITQGLWVEHTGKNLGARQATAFGKACAVFSNGLVLVEAATAGPENTLAFAKKRYIVWDKDRMQLMTAASNIPAS
jgi:hypothetical protein